MSKGKKIVEKSPLLVWAEREVALACEHADSRCRL